MTTADWALTVSIMSAVLSFFALAWNVWQKYIFVRPAVYVGFGVYQIMQRSGPNTMKPTSELLQVTATNMGPGPVIIHTLICRKRRWTWRWKRRFELGTLNPIHGDPTSKTPIGIGPFAGGLPQKLDAAEVKGFFMPYDKDCLLKDNVNRVGFVDTYGRMHWCTRKQMKRARERFREDFGDAKAPAAQGREAA
jgi:hypothetical protein